MSFYRLISLFIFVLGATAHAERTTWSFSIPSGSSGSYTGSESSTGATVEGTFSRLANGWIKMTVTARTGASAPAIGSVRYSLEAPGQAFFAMPQLTTEVQMISTAVSGWCPEIPWRGIFMFSQWPQGVFDMRLATVPAYGEFLYTPSTQTLRITKMYALQGTTLLASNVDFTGATCSNGRISLPGSGDRGGTVFIDPNGGAVHQINQGAFAKSVYAMPQYEIPAGYNPTTDPLVGTYSSFIYDSNGLDSANTIRSVRFSFTHPQFSELTASGDEVTNIETGAVDTTKTWRIDNITINNPVKGFLTGRLTLEGTSGASNNIVCSAYIGQRNVLYCLGNSPTNAAKPINIALVADTRGLKSTGDIYGFNSPLGHVTNAIRSSSAAQAVTIQEDMKTVIVGFSYDGTQTDGFISRYFPNGSLDTGFGTNGVAITADSSTLPDQYNAVSLGQYGRLIAAGYTTTGTNHEEFLIVRYLTSGAIDTNFGVNGKRVISLGAGNARASAMAVQSDNKIILVGRFHNGTNNDVAVVRLTGSGALDTTWNGTGIRTYNLQNGHDDGAAVAIQQDGKIVVVGHSSGGSGQDAFVMRLNTNSSLDTTFNSTGIHYVNIYARPNRANAVAIQADGKIVIAGYTLTSGYVGGLARFNTNGTLDTTWGGVGGGAASGKQISSSCSNILGVGITTTNKIVFTCSQNGSISVRGLTTAGLGDSSWGYGVNIENTSANQSTNALAVQSDGKIVLVGNAANASFYTKIAIVRIWP